MIYALRSKERAFRESAVNIVGLGLHEMEIYMMIRISLARLCTTWKRQHGLVDSEMYFNCSMSSPLFLTALHDSMRVFTASFHARFCIGYFH